MIDCACAILLGQGRILLGKRSPHRAAYPNTWDLIGGKCEPGEGLEAALIREVKEEVGVTPTVFRPIAALSEPRPEVRGARTYHVFLVTAWDGPGPVMLGDEHAEIRWVTIKEALSLDLAVPGYREIFLRLPSEATG